MKQEGIVWNSIKCLVRYHKIREDKMREGQFNDCQLLLLSRTCPRQLCRVEVNDVVVDRGARSHKLAAHRHEKSVEGIDGRFALCLNLAAIKSTSKLDLQVLQDVSNCTH